MSTSKDRKMDPIPPAELWQGPMSWAGSPLRPVQNYSRDFPANASFVRGEILITLSEEIGPGMTRQSERALPGLIELEGGNAVGVHVAGLDGRCWTYRAKGSGRKSKWSLFVGDSFPAEAPAPESFLGAQSIEQLRVQSILVREGSRKAVSFEIRADGRMEDLSSIQDPDPYD